MMQICRIVILDCDREIQWIPNLNVKVNFKIMNRLKIRVSQGVMECIPEY